MACSGRTQRRLSAFGTRRAPAHGFGPGEIAHDPGHRLGEDVPDGAARRLYYRVVETALFLLARLHLVVPRQSGPAQEPFDRLFGAQSVRGPRRSSRVAGVSAGSPRAISASRRAVAWSFYPLGLDPRIRQRGGRTAAPDRHRLVAASARGFPPTEVRAGSQASAPPLPSREGSGEGPASPLIPAVKPDPLRVVEERRRLAFPPVPCRDGGPSPSPSLRGRGTRLAAALTPRPPPASH